MNSILMVIFAVVVVLLVFIMFSYDDPDDEEELEEQIKLCNDEASAKIEAAEQPETRLVVPVVGALPPAPLRGVSTVSRRVDQPTKEALPGSEEDLRFRLSLEDAIHPPTSIRALKAVILSVQIRFGEEVQPDSKQFLSALVKAEEVLRPEKAPFSYDVFPTNQLSRLCILEMNSDRDDAVFEAMVDAFDLVNRFKKTLGSDPDLASAKPRFAVGISMGDLVLIKRGLVGQPSFAGLPAYMAETLAEAAGDFQVYVDEKIHSCSIPLFDFREWKPIKLRTPLSPTPFYELIGWNKKEEIFSYASNEEVSFRRAVAVAYRYLGFEDFAPLLNLLSDSDVRVSKEALATVKELGEEKALGILKKILPEAESPDIRAAIMDALGSVAKEEVLPILLASTKDVHWRVRFSAISALSKISWKDTVKHIESMVSDEDSAVRACVHKLMYFHTKKDSHLTALGEILGDLSGRARKAAIESLMEIGSDRAVDMTVRTFHEQEPMHRKLILKLLSLSKSGVAYQSFLRLFQDAGETGREDIITAVRRAGLVD